MIKFDNYPFMFCCQHYQRTQLHFIVVLVMDPAYYWLLVVSLLLLGCHVVRYHSIDLQFDSCHFEIRGDTGRN